MRGWKNWLFPVLTLLTVAALALLPLRLSALEDGELTGTVHAEGLSEDTNFPFKPPDLPGRIWLLVQLNELPEGLTIMSQELEGEDRDREMERLREALADLGSLLFPETPGLLAEIDGDSWDWTRYYLRDQTDLSSAGFTVASTYDETRRRFLTVTLDGESGQILGLMFFRADGLPGSPTAGELGEKILDRLGLEYVPEGSGDFTYFRLPECRSLFWAVRDGRELDFNFALDWSAVDEEIAASYGHEPTDAGSMQKW